jgi:hypothetical protein
MGSTLTKKTLLALALSLVVTTPAWARVTTADAAKKRGLTLEKTLHADINGNGNAETVGVCQGDNGIQLCIFDVDKNGATLKHLLPRAGGKTLGSIVTEDLLPEVAGAEIILEVYDETPDEKVKRVRVYAGIPEPREVFTSVIFLPKDKSKRGEWDQPNVVQYGDGRPGWFFEDANGDGKKEIIVRRRPKIIPVKRASQDDARLMVGVHEGVYEWVGPPSTGEFREQTGERFTDFLNPGHSIVEVRASSTWVRKDILDELQREALATAVYAAADGKQGGEGVVDLSLFTGFAADKSLDTAWVENDKGDGRGEWIEVVLDETRPIHMVRIVPGCLETKRDFSQHNVPTKVEIRFDNRDRTFVDFTQPQKPLPPAIAVAQMGLPSKPFANQYLVFFDGKASAKTIRFTLDKVKKQGRDNRACIAEITVH